MEKLICNEKGSALVTTLFFLLGLAVTGAIIAGIASSEKQVTHNEYTHMRAVHSSDAASEEAINWVRNITGTAGLMVVPETSVNELTNYTTLASQHVSGQSNRYKYNVVYVGQRPRPGYQAGTSGVRYVDFTFRIDAEGASSQDSEAVLEVRADRLLQLGY